MKVCNSCKVSLPLTDFYHSKTSKDGRGNRCKVCCKAGEIRYKNMQIGRIDRAIKSNSKGD